MIYFLHEISNKEANAVFVESGEETTSEEFETLNSMFSLSRKNGLKVGCYSQDEIRKIYGVLYRKTTCVSGDAYTVIALTNVNKGRELSLAVDYLTYLPDSYSVELKHFKLVEWEAPSPFTSKVLNSN